MAALATRRKRSPLAECRDLWERCDTIGLDSERPLSPAEHAERAYLQHVLAGKMLGVLERFEAQFGGPA